MDNDHDPAQSSATSTRAKSKPTIRRGIQRQSKAERDEYNRKEAEKAKERATQEEAATARSTRGSTAGRGRGAAPRNNSRPVTSTSGGAFTFSGGGHTARKVAQETGSIEALDGGESSPMQDAKPPAGAPTTVIQAHEIAESETTSRRGGKTAAKKESESYAQIEYEQDDPARRDIEQIWISSGDDDEDENPVTARRKKRKQEYRVVRSGASLRPVRAPRTRKDEEQAENTNRAVGMKSTRGSRTTDSTAIIDVDADEMQLDDLAPKKDIPTSPEMTKKPLRRPSNRLKDPKILNETIEERAERLRLSEDVLKLKTEFLPLSSPEGNTAMDIDEPSRMFLFQLPPLVPQLQDPLNPLPDLVQAALDEAATSTTATNNMVKSEPGTTATEAQKQAIERAKRAQEERKQLTANKLEEGRLACGFVGKLNVHQSGKVTLDWGGTDMEVRWGSEVDFLQDAVLVENTEIQTDGKVETDGDDERLGRASSLGQVRRKMVVIPNWSKLYT